MTKMLGRRGGSGCKTTCVDLLTSLGPGRGQVGGQGGPGGGFRGAAVGLEPRIGALDLSPNRAVDGLLLPPFRLRGTVHWRATAALICRSSTFSALRAWPPARRRPLALFFGIVASRRAIE